MPKRPSVPLKRRTRTESGLTWFQEQDLIDGLDFFAPANTPEEIWDSLEAKVKAWRRHGESLLPQYINENGYGKRPIFFWKYSMPEPKRLLGYTSHWWPGKKWEFRIRSQYESDSQYLLRCGICLSPEEEQFCERFAALDTETQANCFKQHEHYLKTLPREQIEAAEKAAGLVSARLKVVA